MAANKTAIAEATTEGTRLEGNSLKILAPLAFIICYALVQCLSIWNYQGDKVDESEIAHYGVGFLGGDLDPIWYGYGYVGMILLGGIYWLIGLLHICIGQVSSLLEFASLLFDTDLFMKVGRLVFALVGATTVYLYVKLGEKLDIKPALVFLFIILSLLSPDGLTYANYIRTDQLVALFCPIILLYLVNKNPAKESNLMLPSIIALAVNCKISALSLLGLLPLRLIEKKYSLLKSFRLALIYMFVFTLVVVAANPFNNLISHLFHALEYMMSDSRVSVSKPGHFGFWGMSLGIYNTLVTHVGGFAVHLLVLLPIILRRNFWPGIYILSLFIILITPYYLTTEISAYWFIPLFSLTRFAAILILNDLLVILNAGSRTLSRVAITAIVIGIILQYSVSLPTHYLRWAQSTLTEKTNVTLAHEYLLRELKMGKKLLLDGHNNHVMPKIYGADLGEARDISRAFLYERKKNPFLVQAFSLFHSERYLTQFESPPYVKKIRVGTINNQEFTEVKKEGAYILVSPNIANRYLLHDGKNFTPERLEELNLFKSYYSQIMSGKLIKQFNQGTGITLELYQQKP